VRKLWVKISFMELVLNDICTNKLPMTLTWAIYLSVGILLGFISAWVIRSITIAKMKRDEIRLNGLLESEKLVKENLRRVNQMAFQQKETMEFELRRKIKETELIIREMDRDILLLQKSNEETEALYQSKEPEIFAVKKKLIEANNTIARLKAELSNHKMPA
jgi:hypothetical protein